MHTPVLLRELIQVLDPKPGKSFIDCTLGEGGHAEAVLERVGKQDIFVGIEKDKALLQKTKKRLKNFKKRHLYLVQGDYKDLFQIVSRLPNVPESFDGIYFDLGICLWHFKESGRGFSFQRDEFLDMRYDRRQKLDAFTILNHWSSKEIARILKEFGQQPFAEQIARHIVRQRKKEPLKTTQQLISVIKEVLPVSFQKRRRHFATQVFQALRIAVNQELESLKQALPQAERLLKRKGRIAVITYHSLEVQIVKRFFKERKEAFQVLPLSPLRPSFLEVKFNPSARSASLWAAQKR